MRNRWSLLLVALAGFGFSGIAHAELAPSFSFDYAEQHATDVVVVDAAGLVLECWRGDLKPGEETPFKTNRKPIPVVSRLPGGEAEDALVPAVSGERRVLFLRRGGENGAELVPASQPKAKERFATVWVEDHKCYAIYQLLDPGSRARMYSLDLAEERLRQMVTYARGEPTAARRSILEELPGEWRIFLPAGFEHRMTVTCLGDNRIRLEPVTYNFGGEYELRDGLLVDVKAEEEKRTAYTWKIRSTHLLTLVAQPHNVGSDYTAAVLFRSNKETSVAER